MLLQAGLVFGAFLTCPEGRESSGWPNWLLVGEVGLADNPPAIRWGGQRVAGLQWGNNQVGPNWAPDLVGGCLRSGKKALLAVLVVDLPLLLVRKDLVNRRQYGVLAPNWRMFIIK